MTNLDEDHRLTNGHQTVKLAQNVVLGVVVRAVDKHLGDALDGEFGALQLQAVSIGRELLCVILDLLGESSRKEENLDVSGKDPDFEKCQCCLREPHGARMAALLLDSHALLA